MSVRNLFSSNPPAADGPKSDLEKTFADLSARNARGETIGQGELDDKLTRVQQVMLRHDADGRPAASGAPGGRGVDGRAATPRRRRDRFAASPRPLRGVA